MKIELERNLEQAEGSIVALVHKTPNDEIVKWLERYQHMNASSAPQELLDGTLCAYALLRGLKLDIDAGRIFE